jgi:hypothetical protein
LSGIPQILLVLPLKNNRNLRGNLPPTLHVLQNLRVLILHHDQVRILLLEARRLMIAFVVAPLAKLRVAHDVRCMEGADSLFLVDLQSRGEKVEKFRDFQDGKLKLRET